MSGFIKLYRQVLDNPVFRSDAEAMAFSWMVLKAAWQPADVRYKGRIVSLERGQLAVSVRDMATALERSKDWSKRFLQRLANRDMIATATATGVNVITICNYNEYQSKPEVGATATPPQPRQDRDRTATQNKEVNELKKKIRTPLPPFVLPEHIPVEAWNGFEEMRNKIRKPMTDRARNGILGELDKLRGPPGEILDQSTMNCWQSVFELKDKKNGPTNRNSGNRTLDAAQGARERLANRPDGSCSSNNRPNLVRVDQVAQLGGPDRHDGRRAGNMDIRSG